MDDWWINGKPGRHVDVLDRGLAYGDGLFETIAVRDGQPRFLPLHLDRLLAGCGRLRIPAPERSSLEARLVNATTGLRHGILKLIVTRGPGPRGYRLPPRTETTVAWGVQGEEPRISLPVAVRWCATMASVNPSTAGLKCLGRLDQVLARAEWTDGHVDEGLMISTDGRLTGGTSNNVFLVAGGRLLTPSVERAGIAGVMRRVVLELASGAGIPARETDIAPAEVTQADELFITNALSGIRPVHRLGGRQWVTGPVTRLLQRLLGDAGVSECAG